LRRYADEGKIKSIKNPAGQRLYDVESYIRHSTGTPTVCYCRVSSSLRDATRTKQRDDLDRQVAYMQSLYPEAEIIKDIGSGLNFKRKRLKNAATRLRGKIKYLVDELHKKTARFLVDNFDVILLPTFETSIMSKKAKRRMRSKSVRQMLTLSHYKFKKFIKHKANEFNKIVIDVNEAYTSKTVSWTGEIINNLGGSKIIKFPIDNRTMNRDLNGARGIYLTALVDTPWLRDNLNLCIC
jgi:IS605 OrfB family transposase